MRRAYLAGPDVFSPDAAALGAAKQALCAQAGLIGLFPLDNDPGAHPSGPGETPAAVAAAIYRGNMAMLRAADLVIANITPFRSPSLDPGTAFEIGVAAAWGKEIWLYGSDPRLLAERTAPDAWLIEDFGLCDNLMIACAAQRTCFLPEPDGSAWGPLAAFAAFSALIADRT